MVLQIIEKLLLRKKAETVNDIIKCYDGNKRMRKTIDRMWSVFFFLINTSGTRGGGSNGGAELLQLF